MDGSKFVHRMNIVATMCEQQSITCLSHSAEIFKVFVPLQLKQHITILSVMLNI